VQLTRFIALVTFLAAAALAALASDFKYQVPTGFRELRTATRPGDADESNVPAKLLREARNPNYILVAVDPLTTTRNSAGATFNVVEMKSTGHMTLDLATKTAHALAASLNATLIDVNVVPINGVDSAMTTLEVNDGRGMIRMRQYVFPGPNGAAVLTYSAPRDDFEKYEYFFTASAKATTGVGEPPGPKWSWKEFFLSGLAGGLLGIAWYVIRIYKS